MYNSSLTTDYKEAALDAQARQGIIENLDANLDLLKRALDSGNAGGVEREIYTAIQNLERIKTDILQLQPDPTALIRRDMHGTFDVKDRDHEHYNVHDAFGVVRVWHNKTEGRSKYSWYWQGMDGDDESGATETEYIELEDIEVEFLTLLHDSRSFHAEGVKTSRQQQPDS